MIRFSKLKHGDDLLNLLATSDKFVPVNNLMEGLDLSRRSVFYLIKKLNQELDENGHFNITNVKEVGYYLPTETITALQSEPKQERFSGLLPIERKQLILFKLINRPYSSLSYLSNYLTVSKNTIIRDFSVVENELKSNHLKLINTNSGKKVIGTEHDKRQWVYEHADELITIYKRHTDPVIYPMIPKQLKLLEQITGNRFTDDATEMFKYFISWYIKRVQVLECQLPNQSNITDYSLVYTWANSLLQDYNINNSAEAEYLAKIINSRQFSVVNWDNPLIKSLKPVTEKMIQRFNEASGYSIDPQQNSLLNNLTVHLLSTYYRVKFDIHYVHPNLDQIKQTYQETFSLTRLAIRPFEKFLSKNISDDEIALIALYFGGALRNTNKSKISSGRVFVVCSSGIGTSQLLLTQLRSLYPFVNFTGPLSVIDYETSSIDNTKLIISTIQLHQRDNIPVVSVSAFPSNSEWNKIKSSLVSVGLITSDIRSQINVGSLLDIISTYSKVIDLPALRKALKNYLSRQGSKTERINPILQETQNLHLVKQDIVYVQNSLSWEKDIMMSLQPLTQQQKVDAQYIQTIIKLIKKHGSYMVLGKGIMLAHASPKDGVNRLGACFSLLKNPIQIGNPAQKVKLVIGLAPIDKEQHLAFLRLLMKYVQDSDWLNAIYKSTSQDELIHLLSATQLTMDTH